jgi:hypothetical protein
MKVVPSPHPNFSPMLVCLLLVVKLCMIPWQANWQKLGISIYTGSSSVGSSGVLAVTDVFKLLDRTWTQCLENFISSPNRNNVLVCGGYVWKCLPEFTQQEKHALSYFENGVWSVSSSTAVIAMLNRWNTDRPNQREVLFSHQPRKLQTLLNKFVYDACQIGYWNCSQVLVRPYTPGPYIQFKTRGGIR